MTISYFFGNGFSGCFLTLQDKYEKELKDAAIRELMLAEEAAMLDKVGVYFFQPPCCFYLLDFVILFIFLLR